MLIRGTISMSNDVIDDQVRAWIVKRTKDYWDAHDNAFLLSDMGSALRREIPEGSFLMADGLRRFLTTWPIVQVVTHPDMSQKVGAVPLGINLPSDLRQLFSRRRTFRTGTSFDKDFWRAFFTPLGAKRRFVILPTSEGENLRIVDVDIAPADAQAHEILSSDLATPPIDLPVSEKAKATLEKIRSWIARNGLSESQFAEGQYERALRITGHQNDRLAQSHIATSPRSGLDALGGLDFSDQSRIFVPLDRGGKGTSAVPTLIAWASLCLTHPTTIHR